MWNLLIKMFQSICRKYMILLLKHSQNLLTKQWLTKYQIIIKALVKSFLFMYSRWSIDICMMFYLYLTDLDRLALYRGSTLLAKLLSPYKSKHKTHIRTGICFTGTSILVKARHYHVLCTRQIMTKPSSMNEFLLSIIAQLPLFLKRYSFSSSRHFYRYVESTWFQY